ncbi:hypothetical protein CKM354_000930500 [Cercospora kikuchii]|uniref:Uncharacterized protein n=1 Tax=Cercospora kikuchii TaxID=84275 RepID=A0A9P3CMY2_9PEZI|nr:uncharacterized protein CKM354_000930500 [Cercospora kikuchii]GIZ46167.1 hypothetical protein CKM354_000930500 [Cercospora kikuchii]
MSSVLRLLNRLLPFATPGTPVYQDVIHLGVLAVLLYFAPQIQENLQRRNRRPDDHVHDEQIDQAPNHQQNDANEPNGNDGVHETHQAERENGHVPPPIQPDAGVAAEEDRNEPGPANPAARMPAAQRNIGAKKAKSLAKKDQRRAYHEFQRSQGDAQRAKDAEGAAEREAAQAAEVVRRKATEAKLEEKKAKEREKRREQERREREEQIALRERAIEFVKEALDERKMCNLFDVGRQVGGDFDEVSLEKILNAAGITGKSKDGTATTMVTSTGWVVRVRKEDMAKAYENAAETGEKEIDWEEFGEILRKTLLEAVE